jgi:hypothetical protein
MSLVLGVGKVLRSSQGTPTQITENYRTPPTAWPKLAPRRPLPTVLRVPKTAAPDPSVLSKGSRRTKERENSAGEAGAQISL